MDDVMLVVRLYHNGLLYFATDWRRGKDWKGGREKTGRMEGETIPNLPIFQSPIPILPT
jgi:hypothetical protein